MTALWTVLILLVVSIVLGGTFYFITQDTPQADESYMTKFGWFTFFQGVFVSCLLILIVMAL